MQMPNCSFLNTQFKKEIKCSLKLLKVIFFHCDAMNFFSVNLFQISYENLVIMKNEQPIFKKMASSFFNKKNTWVNTKFW